MMRHNFINPLTALVFLIACVMILGYLEGDGYAPLFPGDSLEGWKVSDWSNITTPQVDAGTPWRMEDGVLYGLNKRTWIISPRQYSDFVLKLETKITQGSNGGIGLRFPPHGDPAYTGMEIQIVDSAVYYQGNCRRNQRTGAIYDEIAPSKEVVKPVGEWNSWEITTRGSRVAVVLNGVRIINLDMSKETNVRQQKGSALAKRPTKGYIGFQNLNGNIMLRNITIKTRYEGLAPIVN